MRRSVASLFVAVCTLSLTAPLQAQSFFRTVEPSQLFGFTAAIDIEGNELFAARPGEFMFFPTPPDHKGMVHIFTRTGSGWSEGAAVFSESSVIGDGFGLALDVSGNTMVVGAPKQSEQRGAAYVFERSGPGGEWREVAHLTAAASDANARLGNAVAVDGDAILVGAPGRADGVGAVMVYRKRAGAWTHVGTLTGSGTTTGDGFGYSVAALNGRVAIGAPGPVPGATLFGGAEPRPGAAFVFGRSGDGYAEEARLGVGAADGNAVLGTSVELSGEDVLVGAPTLNEGAGGVVRYRRNGTNWSEAGRLAAAQPTPGSLFGMTLAARGADLLVGAPVAQGLGAVVAFRRDAAGAWSETQALGVTVPFAFFGSALALGEDVAVVGGPGSDYFEGSGFSYRRDTSGRWELADTVFPSPQGGTSIAGEMRRCADGEVAGFECSEVDLMSVLPVHALGGGRGVIVNDIWGWTDPESGREYALVGRSNGTSFVDVTDPGNPRYLGDLPMHEGANANIWRDMKVYANHAYIVADGSGQHGVQVFDLTRLRNVANPPATFTEDAHYDQIASAHNIVINEGTGFAYVVGASSGGTTCGGGLHMIDVREPKNPKFAGCFQDPQTGAAGTGYSHDAQCVQYAGPDTQYTGREICFGANETMLSIADVTNKDSTIAISRAAYPNAAYVHQGWISDDHRYFFMNDEGDELAQLVPRTRTIVWDITDLDDPVLLTEYLGETSATDHNLYVRGNYMYESNYASGLRIIDISDPANPKEVGYFDTVPGGENAPGFNGSWSNYPFFASGNIIVSSMREGLFVVKFRRMERPVS